MAEFAEDELIFLPLGGSGEIGMNMNLYGYGGKWLLVDLGITFADGEQAMLEAMLSIKRAGADIILTYAAADLAARLES